MPRNDQSRGPQTLESTFERLWYTRRGRDCAGPNVVRGHPKPPIVGDPRNGIQPRHVLVRLIRDGTLQLKSLRRVTTLVVCNAESIVGRSRNKIDAA